MNMPPKGRPQPRFRANAGKQAGGAKPRPPAPMKGRPASVRPASVRPGSTGKLVMWLGIAGGCFALVLLAVLVAFVASRRADKPDLLVAENEPKVDVQREENDTTTPDIPDKESDLPMLPGEKRDDSLDNDEPSETRSKPKEPSPGPTDSPPENDPGSKPVDSKEKPTEPSTPMPAEKPPASLVDDPLSEIRKADNRVILSSPSGIRTSTSDSQVARILVESPADCDLALVGTDAAFGDDIQLALEMADEKDGSRTWKVLLESSKFRGKAKIIGSLRLKDQSLTFRWGRNLNTGDYAARLRACLLDVSVGNDTERCLLSAPAHFRPITFETLAEGTAVHKWPIKTKPQEDLIMMDLEFDGFPEYEIYPEDSLYVGDKATVTLYKAGEFGDSDGKLMELEFSFNMKKGCEMTIAAFVEPTSEILQDKKNTRFPLTLGWISSKQRSVKSASSKLKKALKLNEKKLANAERRLTKLNDADVSSSSFKVQQKNRFELEKWEKIEEESESAIDELNEGIESAEITEKWLDELKQVCDDLRTSGLLKPRMFFESEGQEIDLLTTVASSKSAPKAPPSSSAKAP